MVKNILKNGKEIADLTGHTVTRKDAPTVYTLMERKGARHEQSRTGQNIQKKRTYPSETLGSCIHHHLCGDMAVPLDG